jgi:hypothetical protein
MTYLPVARLTPTRQLPLKLPSNSAFNTITMGFIVSRLNAFIINRSGGVVEKKENFADEVMAQVKG